MTRRAGLIATVFTSVLGLGNAARADVVVYQNDFSVSAGPEWSDNTTTTSSTGEAFLGASANGFGNGTDTLSLAGLAAHDQVTLTFDLYIIQSWDGNGQNGGGLDEYKVAEDAANLLDTSFANYTGGNTQSYSAATPNGLGFTNAPRSGQFEAGHLGFGSADFGDATYRFTYTFAHTAGTLAIDFTSLQNQGAGDEGWGLDNVTVSIRPRSVPEPSAIALLGLGLAGSLTVARRKRASR